MPRSERGRVAKHIARQMEGPETSKRSRRQKIAIALEKERGPKPKKR